MITAVLDGQLEHVVVQLVETGRYATVDDVVSEGVRLVQDRDAQLARLDAAIERGLADADAGRTRPAEEVFNELRDRYRAMLPKA